MTTNEIRTKFIKYFEAQGHTQMPSSSLVPKDDTSVLLTTAGMQQFKRWFSGAEKPKYSRVVTIQKCVRTNDIEEVGDDTHLTFFEMLGNFSFNYPADKDKGAYYKKESIDFAWEFLTSQEWLGIDKKRIHATYFDQSKVKIAGSPAHIFETDTESKDILESVNGLKRIEAQGDDNFWTLGIPGSPGGPTVEFYVDEIEVWNLVFNEGVLRNDPTEHWYWDNVSYGVDTGMGLERLVSTYNKVETVYNTDEFEKIIDVFWGMLKEVDRKKDETIYSKHIRIIADHIRAAVFLLADGVRPSNEEKGYILRRLIRRSLIKYKQLPGFKEQKICSDVAREILKIYGDIMLNGEKLYPNLEGEKLRILSELDIEEAKFSKTLEAGLKEFDKIYAAFVNKQEHDTYVYFQNGERLFDLFQTFGFPFELSLEELKNRGVNVMEPKVKKEYDALFAKHQEVSRGGMDKKFAGGMENKEDPQIIRYHTAAHLLLAALRAVLGEGVHQKGSNITAERVRFDFSWGEKMTDEQKKAVEDWVNDKIAQKLDVTMAEMSVDEAKKAGAEGEFVAKYGDKVRVYSIGEVSKEICGGPHVGNTSELGHFKLGKEESSSSGVRRIKATLE